MISSLLLLSFVSFSKCISTVSEVDLSKYTGLWIQAYASPFVTHTFERNGVCIAATYGINNDGSISVFNQQRVSTYDGELRTINGYATIPDSSEPGQLSVKFKDNAFYGAPYWIVKLGPDTYGEEGLYQYSVVTDPFKIGLYVLVRDLATFQSDYEDEVLSFLESNGFDHFWNKPIATEQDNCEYVTNDELQIASNVNVEDSKGSIDTVDSLDISKYVGRWYQAYAGKFTFVTTEMSGSCIAADYGIVSTNNISVFNQELGTNGTIQTISGYAYAPNASEPGQLVVDFPFSTGDYWIVKLGPETYGDNGLYQYSIVTDKHKIQLYVIVRDIDTFMSDYNEEVLEFLSSNGFTHVWNSPILTDQNDCTYLNLTPNTYKLKNLRGN